MEEGDDVNESNLSDAKRRFSTKDYPPSDKGTWQNYFFHPQELEDVLDIAEQCAIVDSQSPTRDHFRSLGAEENFASLRLGPYLLWHDNEDFPSLVLVNSVLVEIKTLGHLRAVCEILKIEWKQP